MVKLCVRGGRERDWNPADNYCRRPTVGQNNFHNMRVLTIPCHCKLQAQIVAYAPSKRGGRVTKLCIFPGAANYDARKVHVAIFRGGVQYLSINVLN